MKRAWQWFWFEAFTPLVIFAAAVLFAFALATAGGCVSMTYNTQTHELTYDRLGNQEVEDVEIQLPDGTTVRVGRAKSETRIAEALADTAKALRNASEVVR